MKHYTLFIVGIFASLWLAVGADVLNGVVFVDNPVECRRIQQNGVVTTNVAITGQTIAIDDGILEMVTGPKTLFYFAGGPLVEASANTTLSVNLFERTVSNLSQTARTAVFADGNLSLKFEVGEYCVIYPTHAAGSAMTVTTPYTIYELKSGKYFFRITDKSAVVYVFEGTMNVHGDTRIDKTDKGNLAVAVPFSDAASGVDDKVVTSVKPLKPDEMERFALPIKMAQTKLEDVRFFIIEGKVTGVWLK
jgi:hypothetical protein